LRIVKIPEATHLENALATHLDDGQLFGVRDLGPRSNVGANRVLPNTTFESDVGKIHSFNTCATLPVGSELTERLAISAAAQSS
jgi:hypothetical protein